MSAVVVALARLGCALLVLLVLRHDNAVEAKRPNIIIYYADDLGVGEVNQHAPEWAPYDTKFDNKIDDNLIIQTPGLEKLAKEGVRMMRSYTSSPVCGPARYAMMTGHNVGSSPMRGNNIIGLGNDYPLQKNQETLPRLLKQFGYKTYLIGKWGLGDKYSSGAPWRQSFDRFYGFTTHEEAHHVFPSFLYESEGSSYQEVTFSLNKKATSSRCICVMNENCHFDEDTGQYTKSPNCINANQLFRRKAMEYIERHLDESPDKPFFLLWASITPHNGYYHPAHYLSRDLTSPVSTYGIYSHLARYPGMTYHRLGHMAAITHELDQDILALLRNLKDRGIDDDTVLIFASDNGPHDSLGPDKRYTPEFFHGTMNLRGIKREVYEGGIRSPTMIRWPGKIDAGSTSFIPHAGYDFVLTVAGFAGIDMDHPSLEHFHGLGGQSIHEALLSNNRVAMYRTWLHVEICTSAYADPYKGCDFAFFDLRDPGRTLKIVSNDYEVQMYDLDQDPFEKNDLALKERDTFMDTVHFFMSGQFRTSYCNRAPRDCFEPTPFPTFHPSPSPTTPVPTIAPTEPTSKPTRSPIQPTTPAPTTARPTKAPTVKRSKKPTVSPTPRPTKRPRPTATPTTSVPSSAPSPSPTLEDDNLVDAGMRETRCDGNQGRLSTISIPPNNLKACFAACVMENECEWFHVQHATNMCSLYDSTCKRKGKTSGFTLFQASKILTRYENPRQRCKKGYIRNYRFNTPLECAHACTELRKCRAFAINTENSRCTVYSRGYNCQPGESEFSLFYMDDVLRS